MVQYQVRSPSVRQVIVTTQLHVQFVKGSCTIQQRRKLTVDICVAAQRPAEDRKAAAQKAADTRAERYGDEVKLDAVLFDFDLL